MPRTWTGTAAQRRARLERHGHACIGNQNRCTRTAVTEYAIVDSDDGVTRRPGAVPRSVLSCSTHRKMIVDTRRWIVVGERELERREVSDEEIERAGKRNRMVKKLEGSRFRVSGETAVRVVQRVRFIDDVPTLITCTGHRYRLDEVELLGRPEGTTSVSFSG